MSIKIISTGLQTSIQDIGRPGYRKYGVSQSGALDPFSLQVANWLVGNPINSACLEVSLVGPTLEFQAAMSIAIAGAQFELFINDQAVNSQQTLTIKAGDILRFGRLIAGCRAYISFSGQLRCQPLLASVALDTTAHFGGTDGQCLTKHQVLEFDNLKPVPFIRQQPDALKINYSKQQIIRFIEGEHFPSIKSKEFLKQTYSVTSKSNRMGLRLKGKPITSELTQVIISQPITCGTVQLPNNGQPIITLNEGQTIGGYPKIGQVISADIPLLGQLAPNHSICFYPVSVSKAQQIIEQKNWLYETQLTSNS